MGNQQTKNDIAWEKLFEQYHILEEVEKNGIMTITANQIKSSNREPRLMTKFDSKEDLPKIFSDNHLAILPIERGTYVIGKFQNYYELSPLKNENAQAKYLPECITTITPNNTSSEAISLNAAYLSKMIEDVVGEEVYPSVQGRMGTGEFEYHIHEENQKLVPIHVKNAQMEIDGSYEGKTKFVIVEAKNHSMKDFIIRQLYYPYCVWKKRTSKEIIPVMMIKHNNIYHFYVYEFLDESDYNSIHLKYVKSYILGEAYRPITVEELKKMLKEVVVVEENNKTPFPQANTFGIILDMIEAFSAIEFCAADIQEYFEFVARQANYYLAAAKYLGFITDDNSKLTEQAQEYLKLGKRDRDIFMIKKIIEHYPFQMALKTYLETGMLSKKLIAKFIQTSSTKPINHTTANRRASTVIAWIHWIISQTTIEKEQQKLDFE